MCWRRWPPIMAPTRRLSQYSSLLREEMNARVHGEVDEESWHMKQALLRRDTNVRKETKAFRDYVRQSLIDTLTLYLHGICCDIDVETGPRQLPSRHMRKRLNLLYSLYPPPETYAVFPSIRNAPSSRFTNRYSTGGNGLQARAFNLHGI
jgi:hypothetical protein